MDKTVVASPLKGTLHVIASKSQTHRALIAAALAPGESTVSKPLDSEDIYATKTALTQMGAQFNANHIVGGLKVHAPLNINAKASGSTLRFMIPIALLFDQLITIKGEGRLPKRPLDVYEDNFSSIVHYEYLTSDYLPLALKGPLTPGVYSCAGNISSQFITGLLFALPLLDGDSEIRLTSPLESVGYVNMTIDTLKAFGINISNHSNRYIIKGNQTYHPTTFTVEGDYSQAAFFMVAGVLNGDIKLKNLSLDSLQGDKAIVDLLRSMGADIRYEDDGKTFHVRTSQLKGTNIDLTDIPDLGPILMILAAAIPDKSTFKGLNRLQYKESNRLKTMIDIVNQLGAKARLTDDSLTIEGVSAFEGGQAFLTHDDHRLAMALSVASLKAKQPITIKGAECVKKSYPNFFNDFAALGGTFH